VTVQVNHLQPLTTITHALYPVNGHLKTPLLLALLGRTDTDSVLVFARTKHRAKKVAEQLKNAGYSAASLQGNLSQNRRQEAMSGFRDGSYQILVATDIAARGIDVSQISHVINYDIPDTVEAYTHRIGRTGRMARTGDAFTLVTPEDREMVRAIERTMHSALERRTLPDFDYNAPAPAATSSGQRRGFEPRAPRQQPSGQAGRRPASSHNAPSQAGSHAPSSNSASRPSSGHTPAGPRGAPASRPAATGYHGPHAAQASPLRGQRRGGGR
jgi:ATP-dependent RNA helicase RhlE